MSELNELIYNTMQSNFKEIFSKLDDMSEKQTCCEKDIEYIKKEINGKLDKRIKTAIDFKIIKEKYKGLVGLIGGLFGAIAFIFTVIKAIMG